MEFSKASLDRYITGNYGQNQIRSNGEDEPEFPMAHATSKCLTCGAVIEQHEGMWFSRVGCADIYGGIQS